MPVLINNESGQAENLPQEIADKSLVSGSHSLPLYDPQGNPVTVSIQDAPQLLSQGYRQPSPQDYHQMLSTAKFSGTGETVKAGIEAAWRGVAGPVFTGLELMAGVPAENIRGRQEAHPYLAPAVEAGAFGASTVAGIGEVRFLSEIGEGAKALTGLGGEGASLLSKIAGGAIQGGIEGGVFGAGDVLNDAILGDPNLNSQKIMSLIGSGVIVGGILGGGWGALSKGLEYAPALLKKSFGVAEPNVASEALKEAGFNVEPGLQAAESLSNAETPLRDSIKLGSQSESAQNTIVSELTKLKPNSEEIIQAAKELGAPIPEGLVSGSDHIQRIEDMLRSSPTISGVKRAAIYNNAYEVASNAASKALGGVDEVTARQAGEALKDNVSKWFESKSGPISDLYKTIEEYTPAIPITDKSTGALARNISKIISDEVLVQGTPEYNLVNSFAKGISQVDSLEKMKKFRTALGRATGPDTRFVSSLIKEKLDNLEQNAIKRFAEGMKTDTAKSKILGLLDTIDKAKSGYSALREDMANLGKNVLGRRKIYGPQDFLDSIEETTPEKFAKKMFTKENSQFLEWLNKENPEAVKILSNYERGAIRDASHTNGVFTPKKMFKELDKLSPEVKNVLFNPEELKTIQNSETYLNAFPKDYNPSHTSSMEAYRKMFEHPISGAIMNAKDWAASKLVTTLGDAQITTKLNYITKKIDAVNREIVNGAKAAVKLGYAVPVTYENTKSFNSAQESVNEISKDPDKFMTKMMDNTAGLSQLSPKLGGAASLTASKAASFLKSKIPPQTKPFALSHKEEPTDVEKRKFLEYYNIVNQPLSSFKHIKDGTLNASHMEALSQVYPELLSDMRQKTIEQMHHEKTMDLPLHQKIALAKFLGGPLDENMMPQVVLNNQMALNAPSLNTQSLPKQGRKTQALGPMKNLKVSSRVATRTQQDDED